LTVCNEHKPKTGSYLTVCNEHKPKTGSYLTVCNEHKPKTGSYLTAVVHTAFVFARQCQITQVIQTHTGII